MKYRVIGPVASFAAGQELTLSIAQIEARAHRLELVNKRGKVRATGPLQFKKGETLSLAGGFDNLPGSLKAVLLPEADAKKLDRQAEEDAQAAAEGDASNEDDAADNDETNDAEDEDNESDGTEDNISSEE